MFICFLAAVWAILAVALVQPDKVTVADGEARMWIDEHKTALTAATLGIPALAFLILYFGADQLRVYRTKTRVLGSMVERMGGNTKTVHDLVNKVLTNIRGMSVSEMQEMLREAEEMESVARAELGQIERALPLQIEGHAGAVAGLKASTVELTGRLKRLQDQREAFAKELDGFRRTFRPMRETIQKLNNVEYIDMNGKHQKMTLDEMVTMLENSAREMSQALDTYGKLQDRLIRVNVLMGEVQSRIPNKIA